MIFILSLLYNVGSISMGFWMNASKFGLRLRFEFGLFGLHMRHVIEFFLFLFLFLFLFSFFFFFLLLLLSSSSSFCSSSMLMMITELPVILHMHVLMLCWYVGTGPSVQMRQTKYGGKYLKFLLPYWGNAITVVVQCDDLVPFHFPLNSGTAGPHRVCLQGTESISWCNVEIRPAGCVEQHDVYKQWNVSVIEGLLFLVFRFIFMIINTMVFCLTHCILND